MFSFFIDHRRYGSVIIIFLTFCLISSAEGKLIQRCRDKISIALVNFNFLQVLIQCSSFNSFPKNFLGHLVLKAINQVCTFVSVHNVPHLGLTVVAFVLSCICIIGMNLNRQIFLCIDEFHQYRQFSVFHLCTKIFRVSTQHLCQRLSLIDSIRHITGTIRMYRAFPCLRQRGQIDLLSVFFPESGATPQIVLSSRNQFHDFHSHHPFVLTPWGI